MNDIFQSSFLENQGVCSSRYLVEDFSAGGFYTSSARIANEKKYAPFLHVTDRFNRQTVSYQLSKNDTLHSWLKYKEGFSANLVNRLLVEMEARPGQIIMDPFMGSGTTALVCQMHGINSMGYDIMPISKISIDAKSYVRKYNPAEIEKMISDIERLEMPDDFDRRTPYIVITRDAYPEYTEKFIQFITEWNESSPYSEAAKNLLTLCIVNSLESMSFTSKDGQYLGWDSRSKKIINGNQERIKKGLKPYRNKTVRDVIASPKEAIVSELRRVLNDIVYVQSDSNLGFNASIDYKTGSVLYELPKVKDNYIDGVITSPPYCNRYDYTRIYALELVYLGNNEKDIKKMRQELLSCTVESRSKMSELEDFYNNIQQLERYRKISDTINQNEALQEVINALKARRDHGDLNNNGVIRMVDGYFTELAFVYAELYRICKPGSTVCFVNDNVRYGGEVIPVDFISCSLAEQFGFNVKEVYCIKQQKGNSSQQMAKYGRVALRKSITIWEKY